MLEKSRSHLLRERLDGKPVGFGLMDRKPKAVGRQHQTEKHCRTKKWPCGLSAIGHCGRSPAGSAPSGNSELSFEMEFGAAALEFEGFGI